MTIDPSISMLRVFRETIASYCLTESLTFFKVAFNNTWISGTVPKSPRGSNESQNIFTLVWYVLSQFLRVVTDHSFKQFFTTNGNPIEVEVDSGPKTSTGNTRIIIIFIERWRYVYQHNNRETWRKSQHSAVSEETLNRDYGMKILKLLYQSSRWYLILYAIEMQKHTQNRNCKEKRQLLDVRPCFRVHKRQRQHARSSSNQTWTRKLAIIPFKPLMCILLTLLHPSKMEQTTLIRDLTGRIQSKKLTCTIQQAQKKGL